MRSRLLFLACPLVASFACMPDPNADFRASQPDRVLFARARSAAEHHHLDVARMTLQTLVNTYPDSEYAGKAQRVLDDPRMRACGDSENMQFGSSPPEVCGEDGAALTSLEDLEFFADP